MATRTAKPAADLAYLCRAMKAPSLAAAIGRLGERARSEGWTHEEFLAACLEREVAARQDHGGEGRIKTARFPGRKVLEDFDFDHQRSLKRETILHLGTLDFVAGKENVVFLGPPGTSKTHLAIGLGIRACQAGHRVAFATAAEWVARLAEAHAAGRLHAELTRLGRVPLASGRRRGQPGPFWAPTASPGVLNRAGLVHHEPLGRQRSSDQVAAGSILHPEHPGRAAARGAPDWVTGPPAPGRAPRPAEACLSD